jgi:hypothetical protein
MDKEGFVAQVYQFVCEIESEFDEKDGGSNYAR